MRMSDPDGMLEGMYREWASRLPGAVAWERTVSAVAPSNRILPDGCMDLIWSDGELIVAGPDTTAHLSETASGATFSALRFAPGMAPAVLGVPAHELRDRRVALDRLWPAAEVRRITERIDQAPDRPAALEELAIRRLDQGEPPAPAVAEIVRRLTAGRPVAATAEVVGLSERQLHRRCQTAFGYGPKTLVRILRMNRALALARGGTPFALVAAVAGYADQAHLSREVKALAGVPLGALV